MKNLILFSLLLFSGLVLSQDIMLIKKEVAEINQIKNYSIKVVPYSYFMDKHQVTDNGIELKGYYKSGKLRKIDHFIGLSAWYISTEYFLDKNGQLIFVYSKKYQTVDENGYLKNPIKISEIRNYYAKGKLIETVKMPENQIEDADYLRTFQELKKDLNEYK
ncbi:hypothetical protein VUJ46_04565 [Chryseobacterium sp. MYb264]|uniref:hypothetical protein n=1 Tax=Chryseobacterium sp. MYb264 TaxID=2745153 RepID=UPI002E0EA794|nr:hypothetical protein VUJ46_04565 [Chryseobacterium sp. MYb264]